MNSDRPPADRPTGTDAVTGADARRPLRADARRNRERVIDAAQALIASDGLALPVREIARRAGVGAGTVHRHFPTKQALLAAIVIDRVEKVIDEARALADAEDPGDALLRTLRRMLDEGTESAALKAALAGTDFDLRTAAPNVARELRDALTTLLANAQHAGHVRRDIDIDDVLALLAGAFASIQHASADRTRAARLTDVLFDGLRTC